MRLWSSEPVQVFQIRVVKGRILAFCSCGITDPKSAREFADRQNARLIAEKSDWRIVVRAVNDYPKIQLPPDSGGKIPRRKATFGIGFMLDSGSSEMGTSFRAYCKSRWPLGRPSGKK